MSVLTRGVSFGTENRKPAHSAIVLVLHGVSLESIPWKPEVFSGFTWWGPSVGQLI